MGRNVVIPKERLMKYAKDRVLSAVVMEMPGMENRIGNKKILRTMVKMLSVESFNGTNEIALAVKGLTASIEKRVEEFLFTNPTIYVKNHKIGNEEYIAHKALLKMVALEEGNPFDDGGDETEDEQKEENNKDRALNDDTYQEKDDEGEEPDYFEEEREVEAGEQSIGERIAELIKEISKATPEEVGQIIDTIMKITKSSVEKEKEEKLEENDTFKEEDTKENDDNKDDKSDDDDDNPFSDKSSNSDSKSKDNKEDDDNPFESKDEDNNDESNDEEDDNPFAGNENCKDIKNLKLKTFGLEAFIANGSEVVNPFSNLSNKDIYNFTRTVAIEGFGVDKLNEIVEKYGVESEVYRRTIAKYKSLSKDIVASTVGYLVFAELVGGNNYNDKMITSIESFL